MFIAGAALAAALLLIGQVNAGGGDAISLIRRRPMVIPER
jgi:hypothetical protein